MSARAPMDVLQEATVEVERLIKLIKKSSAQVRSNENRQTIRATALAWFNNHRSHLEGCNAPLFANVEKEYTNLFDGTSYATTRTKYLLILKSLKDALTKLQTHILTNRPASGHPIVQPNFSPLVPDAKMRQILENRWNEINRCLDCKAALAATVMMGGLLEALFLARIHREADKKPIFMATAAPRDPKTSKTRLLNEWTLAAFIDVAAELKWITKPAKDIGVVLRNYRNYIHPERELSTGITLMPEDAIMFWSISTSLVQQLLEKRR